MKKEGNNFYDYENQKIFLHGDFLVADDYIVC